MILELIFTEQLRLIESEATTGRNASYFQSLAFDHDLGRTRGIDAALQQFNLDALVLPAPGLTTEPAGKQHSSNLLSPILKLRPKLLLDTLLLQSHLASIPIMSRLEVLGR